MKRILFLLLMVWATIAILSIDRARDAIASVASFTYDSAASVGRVFDPRDAAPDNGGRNAGKRPPTLQNDGPKCLSRLENIKGLSFTTMDPFANANGCGVNHPVLVSAVGDIDIQGRGLVLSCPSAEGLAKWLNKDVGKILEKHDKAALKRLNHLGSYNCRRIAGSGTWSQHAYANAVDVTGLVFEDGEEVSILNDWDDEPVLHDLSKSACGRFNVVLSPDYNEAHKDHLHFDLGPYRVCR
ncbi:MAG: extensin family protein [Alphaproteobacteria bacterium]